ncbi:MAG: MMPL family transporter, partial [Acidimicrobiales bacterium]|nr:MMPL family transporter [Acidimicrobiales bacterium]
VFIAAVVLLSFVLLTAVFRSPLVALKAALVNLLGIAAAYGVLVAVFQWGWGLSLVGLEETVPIISFLPMMMFAILFGLSMDYEVFILSRVREDWLASGEPTGSIVHGIAVSARVITAAALIMISVFASFVLGESPEIKMFGVGLAVAVALDATIVRMIVVPATMTLLGARNWWIPGWLDRILPRLDIEGETALPSAHPDPVPPGDDTLIHQERIP